MDKGTVARFRPRRPQGGLRSSYWALAALGLALGAGTVMLSPQIMSRFSDAAKADAIEGARIIIVDGDTVDLPCAAPAPGCSERIRLTAIDAPEISQPHCDAELASGLKAKARLADLLRAGPVTIRRTGRTDRYGRTLADLAGPDGDVGQILMREELALAYAPGARAKAARIAHWCGPE